MSESEQAQADSRTDDWRQEAPEFLLESTQILESGANSPDSPPQQYAMAELTRILADYVEERYEKAKYRSSQVIQHISETQPTENFPEQEKQNILANLYSCKGNAALEMGLMEEALECHLTDLKLAEDHHLLEAKSRALANVGRVHARAGRFRDAIDVWKDRVELCASSEERAWLFHEMGRCYYEMIEYNEALEMADQAWVNAQETDDTDMQFRASYLMAQCYEKLEALEEAVVEYKKALDLAFVSDNEDEASRIEEIIQKLSQELALEISRQRSQITRTHTVDETAPGLLTARDVSKRPVSDTYYLTLLYLMATLPEY